MMGDRTPPGLANKRAAARAALWVEQVWPAVWPAVGVAGGFVVLALLDVPAMLPPWPRVLLPVVALALVAGLLWRRVRRVVRPGAAAVDRRLELASGLRHRPLSALQDRPAAATAEAASIWAVHQDRLAAQVRRLRAGRPRPGLAARDRWALRGLLVVALAASTGIAGIEAPGRLLAAVAPPLPTGPAAPGTLVQAWVTPPAYTGLPPVFLQTGAAPGPIPIGAHLTVSVTGGQGEPALALNDEATGFRALDGASWQAERDLAAPGQLIVRRGGQVLANWPVTILPDRPPSVMFTEPPGTTVSAARATTPQTRLAWRAEDDYGVIGVQAELRLKDRPGAPPLVLTAPLSGGPKQARGAIVQDLTPHPWAGLAVVARMVARDAAEQAGVSADETFELPERPFQNPVAQALIAIRKQLSRTPDERQGPRMALDAVAERPELFDGAFGVVLQLRAVASLLQRGRGQPAVDDAQARLWELAVALEEGAADRTAHALEQARQAMRDAMEAARAEPENKQLQAELQRRMEELRAAIQRHIEALAEQARREGTEMPFDPSQPQMNARELDRMAQAMEQAAKEGRMDDAKQQMAQLEKLLEQLQNARPEHGEQREQRNAERRQQGQQQMDAVQDMVQREGGLLDRSQARAETLPQRPPQAQPRGAPNQAARPAPDRGQDQKAQNAMRRALGELMQRFGDLTGQVPAPLSEADTAMRDAGQAMNEGRDGAAGAAQQRAIEALQKGGRAMGQQLSRQFGSGEQDGEGQDGQDMSEGEGGQAGQGDNPAGNRDGMTNGSRPGEQPGPNRRRSTRRDPLGRPLPNEGNGQDQAVNGQEGAGSVRVPDQMEQARTRELQEELRRRGADRTRPQPELDYIDRLLKAF